MERGAVRLLFHGTAKAELKTACAAIINWFNQDVPAAL